jgi:hypothetical protein
VALAYDLNYTYPSKVTKGESAYKKEIFCCVRWTSYHYVKEGIGAVTTAQVLRVTTTLSNFYVNCMLINLWTYLICLFEICLKSYEQFFIYLTVVTITVDGTANLHLCLALTAFSSKNSFTCQTCCDTGPTFLRPYAKDLWFSPLNAVLLAKEQQLPILTYSVWYGRH